MRLLSLAHHDLFPCAGEAHRRFPCIRKLPAVVQEVLGGVAFLHERHVSHRDLKPDNILLLDDGPNPRVKIAGACVRSLID